jgi:hypothetical protein
MVRERGENRVVHLLGKEGEKYIWWSGGTGRHHSPCGTAACTPVKRKQREDLAEERD